MENFRIESLEINKIGAFEHIKMDFPKKTDPDKAEIHILTGENGTGKSTILECLTHCTFTLEELRDSIQKRQFFFKVRSLEHFNFIISTNLSKSLKYSFDTDDIFNFRKSSFSKYNTKTVKFKESKFDYALFAYSGYRKTDEYSRVDISKPLDSNPFENALDFSKSTNTENLLNWIGYYLMKATLAIAQKNEEKAQIIMKPILIIHHIIESIIEKPVYFQLHENLEVLINIDNVPQYFSSMPDGLKSMISWVGDLIMRLDRIQWNEEEDIFDRNFILFLDEIEVHLHPAWQRKILPIVQEYFKNAQIFISTHSPFVVGSVDGAWVHKLKKDGAFAVLDGEPVLSEDGKSVRRILDETFGINQQYGVEVEKDLAKFREFRQKIMLGYEYNFNEFDKLVKHLASQSTELEQMMGMEMNQLKRITQKELV